MIMMSLSSNLIQREFKLSFKVHRKEIMKNYIEIREWETTPVDGNHVISDVLFTQNESRRYLRFLPELIKLKFHSEPNVILIEKP